MTTPLENALLCSAPSKCVSRLGRTGGLKEIGRLDPAAIVPSVCEEAGPFLMCRESSEGVTTTTLLTFLIAGPLQEPDIFMLETWCDSRRQLVAIQLATVLSVDSLWVDKLTAEAADWPRSPTWTSVLGTFKRGWPSCIVKDPFSVAAITPGRPSWRVARTVAAKKARWLCRYQGWERLHSSSLLHATLRRPPRTSGRVPALFTPEIIE